MDKLNAELEKFDVNLGKVLDNLKEDDLLIITGFIV